jgi:predicted small metal-binding protein
MTRKYIDCREYPSEMNCTVALSADSDKELLEAAVQHAVSVHQHEDTPEFRQQLKQLFKEGTPPIERQSAQPAWEGKAAGTSTSSMRT